MLVHIAIESDEGDSHAQTLPFEACWAAKNLGRRSTL